MNINDSFPSNFLKATDFQEADQTLTIKSISMEMVGQGPDASEKPILYFKGQEKGLVLNKTNSTTIAGLYGPETDNWIGKGVTLFATEVDFQGKQVLSIRIRMRKPQPAARPAPAGPGQQAMDGRRPPTRPAAAPPAQEPDGYYASEADQEAAPQF